MLIADRYYGVAKFVSRLLALPSKPSFLVRARDNLTRKFIHSFRDGSCLIEIRDATKGTRVQVREIYARVRRRSGRWVSVRLWTNLLNPHPRRPRSCPRALRQPVSNRPRLRRNASSSGPFQFKVTPKHS